MASDGTVTVDLTATQYVILSENQRKKKALADTKDAYNQLLFDNQALLQQLEDTNREAYHAAEHFRQEVLGKSQKIAELQTQLEQLRYDKDEHISRLQDHAAAREAQLQAEAEALSTELMARIDSLQTELDGVLEFKQRRAESEAGLAALREETVGLREALDAQRAQLERHYAGLHAKMRKEYEQRLEELKRSQEEELEERLDAGVKRILAANRRLAEELRLHVTESNALQAELKLLQAERGTLSREVALKQQLELGWAARAGQQAAALKQAQAKAATLEQSLQQVLSDFARERAGVVARAQAQVTAAGGEVDALRRLLRLKGRELQQLRRLAQQVLLQRTEVEIFLLSSLHQVRLSLECERGNTHKQQCSSSNSRRRRRAQQQCSRWH
ncbi:flagellar/basal body protein [Scenedesmus sp. NREL 46B-D3]|nr:flagellar/basal body protein [Scenedesmus sp. NREL 46B-D3]